MSSSEKEPLDNLAEGVADGVAIDWEQARADHGGDLRRLRALELLEEVGKSFHAAGATSCSGDPETPILFSWGPLDVLEKLDEGSYGEVYRALDRQLQRPVALKLRKATTGDGEADWIAEGRRLAKLRHPNVLTVHGVGSHQGRVGLWTELLTSPNLRQQLADHGLMGLDDLVAVGVAVCEALSAIHQAGMVHGDVKASNVVREDNGNVVLLDFGSSTDLSQISSGSQGSPLTTAPEVLDGARPAATADVYSLGAMLYLLASGRPPIDAEQYQELQRRARAGEVASLATLRPDLPRAFAAVVHQALGARADQRYPSAEAFAAALRAIVSTSGEKQSTVRGTRLAQPIAALAMLALAAAVLTAGWWVLSSTDEPSNYAHLEAPSRLTVRADLIRAEAPDVPLADGASIGPGDRLAMQLELEQPTHLYLINEDEQGESFVLFPLPDVEPHNPLPAGSHLLPGAIAGQPQNWIVTSTGGAEHFLVIASAHALPVVEQFIENTRKAGGGRTTDAPGDVRETVRGVGGLAPTDALATHKLEALQAAIAATEEQVWLQWVRLDNPQ